MDLGPFVRERRRAMNLTQQQLADRAGVGLNFVYQLEKNKPTIQLDCVRQVLGALGYELDVRPKPVDRSVYFPHLDTRTAPPSPWGE